MNNSDSNKRISTISKLVIYSFLVAFILLPESVNGQLNRIHLEETILTSGTVAGMTNYRIFAEATMVTDQVDRVFGSSACPTNINALDNPWYVHAVAGDIESSSINTIFFGFGLPEILHTTILTIGTGAIGYLGVPLAEDGDGALAGLIVASDGLIPLPGGSSGITYLDATDPWSVMAGGGNLVINSVAGGTWFTTGGTNALGYGVNNSVLLASLTTAGDISFNLSVGTQEALGSIDYLSCSDNIDNLIYPLTGCIDVAACNYNAFADIDPLADQCVYALGCDECVGSATDGTGTLIDNPDVGEPCDDGEPGTVGDVVQPDCICTGEILTVDDCSSAIAMTLDGGTVVGDNTGAGDQNDPDAPGNEELTVEGDLAPVGFWGTDGDDGDVWFSFVGSGGLVDIETFDIGGSDDTQIALYSDCAGTILAADDDNAATGGNFMSQISAFCAETNVIYYVEVEGWNGTEGTFNIEVRTSTSGPATVCDDETAVNFVIPTFCDIVNNGTCIFPPANDTCATAEALATNGTPVTGDNTGATATPDDFGNDVSPDVWYSFIGTGNKVDIETFGNGGMTDSRIAVYGGLCGSTSLDSDDDNGGGAMSLIADFCTIPDLVYYIEVQGFNVQNSSIGSFEISVNDNGPDYYCSDPGMLNYEPFPGPCQIENNNICWSFEPNCLDPEALNYYPAAEWDCHIVVGGNNTSCCIYPASNDLCTNAIGLIVDAAAVTGTNQNASPTSTDTGNAGALDVWYSFDGADGLVDIEVFGNGGMTDSYLTIYDGCSGAALGFNDDEPSATGNFSLVEGLCTESGTTYLVEVQGFGTSGGSVGSFDISVVTSSVSPTVYCSEPGGLNYLANPTACDILNEDLCPYIFTDCSSAELVIVDAAAISGNNTFTLDENFGNEPTCFLNDGAGGGDVWFSFVGTGGLVDIQTFEGTNNDTQIAIYNDCSGSLLECNDDIGGGNFMSLIEGFCSHFGVTYYIEVEGYGNIEGTFDISVVTSSVFPTIYCSEPGTPNYLANPTICDIEDNDTCPWVQNDYCTNAEPIVVDGYIPDGNNSYADSDADAPGTSSGAPNVWYSFIGTGYSVNIETHAGTLNDTQIAIFDDCGGNVLAIDIDSGEGQMSLIENFCTEVGQEYFIEVQGWNDWEGTFSISIETALLSCNNSCEEPLVWDQIDADSPDLGINEGVWVLGNSPNMIIESLTGDKLKVRTYAECGIEINCDKECAELIHGASGLMYVTSLQGLSFSVRLSDCSTFCDPSICNDPTACNFDSNDIGIGGLELCKYNCCVDETASNYLENCYDLDECYYNLPGDYNYDQAYNIVDFAGILSEFGQSCSNLTGDFNQDNAVNVDDVSLFLAVFGTTY